MIPLCPHPALSHFLPSSLRSVFKGASSARPSVLMAALSGPGPPLDAAPRGAALLGEPRPLSGARRLSRGCSGASNAGAHDSSRCGGGWEAGGLPRPCWRDWAEAGRLARAPQVFPLCLAGEAGGRAVLRRESESIRTLPWGWRIGFLLCAGEATEAVLLRWTCVLSLESLKKVSSF